MNPFRRHWLLWSFLLLLIAVTGGVWLGADVFLDRFVKPRLAAAVAEQLQADVALERIVLQGSSIQLDGLHIEKRDELDLAIPKIRLAWDWQDVWRRKLTRLEVEQPEVQVRLAKSTDSEPPPLAWPGLPFSIKTIVVQGGQIQVASGERQFLLNDLNISLPLGAPGPLQVRAEVGPEKLSLLLCGEAVVADTLRLRLDQLSWAGEELLDAPLELGWAADSGAGAEAAISLDNLDQATVSGWLAAFELSLPKSALTDWRVEELAISGRLEKDGVRFSVAVNGADFTVAERQLRVDEFRLEGVRPAQDWLLKIQAKLAVGLSATFQGTFGDSRLSGDWNVELVNLRRAAQRLAALSLSCSGGLGGGGTVDWQDGQGRIVAQLQGTAGEEDPSALWRLQSLSAKAEIDIDASHIQGNIQLNRDRQPWLSVSGTPEQARFKLEDFSLQDLKQVTENLLPDALQDFATLSAEGELRQGKKGIWDLSAEASAKSITLSAGEISEPHLALQARWQGERLLVDSLKLKSGWNGFGTTLPNVSLAADGTLSARSANVRINNLHVVDIEYLREDGMAGFTGGHVLSKGVVEWQQASRQISWSGTLALGVGEFLYGALYADLSDLPAEIEASLRFDIDQKILRLPQMRLRVADLLHCEQSGEVSAEHTVLTSQFELPDLDGKLAKLIKDIGAPSFPQLKDMDWRGRMQGEVEMSMDASGGVLAGMLQPQQVAFSWPETKLDVAGVDGRLPLLLGWGSRAVDSSFAVGPQGRLTVQRLQVGPVSLYQPELDLQSHLNRWHVTSPLLFDLAGGTLSIADLLAGWNVDGPLIGANIRLGGVDLGRLTEELQVAPLSGALNADLGEIRFHSNALESSGEVQVDVFGGHLRIRNIRYQDPFSSYATLHADLDFNDLDLQQLTQTFEFGEMNGVLHGYVHNLRLFGLVPSGFDALIESQESGKRNISVKALNNLAVISQGALLGTLSRGVYRFIDFYRYRKIGLRLNLENDVFRLTGTALPDDNRYLVYGGVLPPRIDIVAPQNAISFKEMLKRLRRIDRTSRGS